MTIRKVERNGESRLVIDIYYTKKDGTLGRYRRDASVNTSTAARAEERRILTNIAQFGAPFEPKANGDVDEVATAPVAAFAAIVETFEKTTAVSRLKPSTRVGYREVFRTRLLPEFGDTPIDRIDLPTMTRLDAGMVTEGLSASRRRNVLICLRSVLRAAHASKQLPQLPTFPALPKKGRKSLTPLRREQVDAILRVSSPTARMAFALAAFAGLRAGEVRALRWADVDLERGILTVRLSMSKGETSTPKSGHEREVPIAGPLMAILKECGKKSRRLMVARTVHGNQWRESGLLQAFRRAQKRVGVEGFRFHDLRHFFVTELFRTGGSAPAVQMLAGHLHLSTTSRYAHLGEDDLRKAIRSFAGNG